MGFIRLLIALVTVSSILIGSGNAEAAFEKGKRSPFAALYV